MIVGKRVIGNEMFDEFNVNKNVFWIICRKEVKNECGKKTIDFKIIPIATNRQVEDKDITKIRDLLNDDISDLCFKSNISDKAKEKCEPVNWDVSGVVNKHIEGKGKYIVECVSSYDFARHTIKQLNGLYEVRYDENGRSIFYKRFGINTNTSKEENLKLQKIKNKLGEAIEIYNMKTRLVNSDAPVANVKEIVGFSNAVQEQIFSAYKLAYAKQTRQYKEQQELEEKIQQRKNS